jgi:hypothetical protein
VDGALMSWLASRRKMAASAAAAPNPAVAAVVVAMRGPTGSRRASRAVAATVNRAVHAGSGGPAARKAMRRLDQTVYAFLPQNAGAAVYTDR